MDSYEFNYKDLASTIHPTHKPVQLYKWLLKNYAKEGDNIIDTHLGSGSSVLLQPLTGDLILWVVRLTKTISMQQLRDLKIINFN